MAKVQGSRIDSAWRLGPGYRRQNFPALPCRLADAHYLGRQGFERNSAEAVAHLNLIAAARLGDTEARAKLNALSGPITGEQPRATVKPMIDVVAEATRVATSSADVVAKKYVADPLTFNGALRVAEIIIIAKAIALTQTRAQKGGIIDADVSRFLGLSYRELKYKLAVLEHSKIETDYLLQPFKKEDSAALLKEAGITVSAEDIPFEAVMRTAELTMLTGALAQAGTVSGAAELLGTSFRTMRFCMSKYGLRKD